MISPEYAAGFFDGEGCVNFLCSKYIRKGQLRSRSIHIRVTVANTDLIVLQRFAETFGGYVDEKRQFSNPRAKQQWVWYAMRKDAVPFLKAIQPFAIVKSRQIALALEFCAWRDRPAEERCDKLPGGQGTWVRRPETLEKEDDFKLKMHELNGGLGRHRGGVPTAFHSVREGIAAQDDKAGKKAS